MSKSEMQIVSSTIHVRQQQHRAAVGTRAPRHVARVSHTAPESSHRVGVGRLWAKQTFLAGVELFMRGTIGLYDNVTIIFVVGLAQEHVGRVARTNISEVSCFGSNVELLLMFGAQKLLRNLLHRCVPLILQLGRTPYPRGPGCFALSTP